MKLGLVLPTSYLSLWLPIGNFQFHSKIILIQFIPASKKYINMQKSHVRHSTGLQVR